MAPRSAAVPQEPVPSYDEMSAAGKQEAIWEKILASEYASLPPFDLLGMLPLLEMMLPWNKRRARRYLDVTVERRADVLPEGRRKIVHPLGAVALCALTPHPQSPYSGLYQGTPHALIRISLAAMPLVLSLPGVAIKLFVDGAPSENFLAMHSLTGQLSASVFAKDLSNVIPRPSSPLLEPLAGLFGLVSPEPTRIDVGPLAGITSSGQVVPAHRRRGPQRLRLMPNPSLVFANTPHDFRDDLAQIQPGTVLYQIFGDDGTATLLPVGELRTTSRFVASAFGDESLFFHHQVVVGSHS